MRTYEDGIEAAAESCEQEAARCLGDIVPGDDIGAKQAHARAGALLTAAADIRALSSPPPGAGEGELRELVRDFINIVKAQPLWAANSEALVRLEDALATPSREGEKSDGWLDIKTAPKDGTAFLAWAGNYYLIKWARTDYYAPLRGPVEGWFVAKYNLDWLVEGITKWQPLPAAPSPADEVRV